MITTSAGSAASAAPAAGDPAATAERASSPHSGFRLGKSLVVAIDGPSGSGKSSVSREVARWLRSAYLDTGAMYRAVTLHCVAQGIDLEDAAAVADDAPPELGGSSEGTGLGAWSRRPVDETEVGEGLTLDGVARSRPVQRRSDLSGGRTS